MTKENFERYEYFEGADILNLNSGVVGGMLNIINNTAFEISPTVFASCSPGGVIEDNCYLDIKNKILKKIKNTDDLVGVLLPLHGAAVTQTIGDLEGDLISSVREVVGNKIPIVVTLDLHAHVTKKMITNLKKSKKGIFIFIGSEASKIGGSQGTLYCSAKHGLLGFFKSFKLEANKSLVRATIINPGMVRTSFFDKLSFGPGTSKNNAIDANDIAEIVYFLSKSSKYVNFSDINIDPMKKVVIHK